MVGGHRVRDFGIWVACLWVVPFGSAEVTQLPQFRAGVDLVRIEVRVLDRNGNPLRDLSAEDFSIRENGHPETIAYFARVTTDNSRGTAGRTFAIVLGRGDLNARSKAVQALGDFVREKLTEADRIAVIAYNRVLGPTTDRAQTVRFIDAYRENHGAIEQLIRRDSRPASLGAHINLRSDTVAAITTFFAPFSADTLLLPGGAGQAALSFTDRHYLRATLSYLRSMEGEKHVIIVTQEVFPTGVGTEDSVRNQSSYWFRQATSARAALSFIHTGGPPPLPMSRGRLTIARGPSRLDDLFRRKAQEVTATHTGGTAAFFQAAAEPLAAIDVVTREFYVLGYYPSRKSTPEEFRDIEVIAKPPSVKLFYRHAYQAKAAAENPEDFRIAMTEQRTAEGAARLLDRSPVSPSYQGATWGVRITPAVDTQANEVRATVAFDPSFVEFTRDGDRYYADLDLLVVADDHDRNSVGEVSRRVHVSLTAKEFATLRQHWLTTGATITVKGKPSFLRAVIYQFNTDRLGAGQVRLR